MVLKKWASFHAGGPVGIERHRLRPPERLTGRLTSVPSRMGRSLAEQRTERILKPHDTVQAGSSRRGFQGAACARAGATRKLPSAFRRRRISWLRPTAIPSVWRPTARRVKPWRTSTATEIAQGGAEALEALPGVGPRRSIMQLVETGRWPYLEQLRGSADPVRLFQMIPGIGPELAQRIHLCMSRRATGRRRAHRGRLDKVPGTGARRTTMLRTALAGMLSRSVGAVQRRRAQR